jgi:exosortase/archaeosortase family protein
MQRLSFKKSFLLFLTIYFVLNLAYFKFFPKGTLIDDALRKSETAITTSVLQLFLNDVNSISLIRENDQKSEEIYINGIRTMGVINECNALKIHLIFSIFILIINGSHAKSLMLIIGNGMIYLVNIIRLISLTLILHYSPDNFEFHHEYTFSLLLYLIVFVMWYFYINEKQKITDKN